MIDPPNPNRVYRNYLETCRRQGIEPVPRERAGELMQEWAGALKGLLPKPPGDATDTNDEPSA